MRRAGTTRRAVLSLAAGALALAAWPGPRSARAATPIRHLVLILRENHSFDNYFGSFPGAKGETGEARCMDAQADPPHGYRSGRLGPTRGPNGLCHYREADIPQYFAYAREYALCDNYFAELKAGSEPNYFMLMAGQSPIIDNFRGEPETGAFDLPSIVDRLGERGIAWRNYSADTSIRLVSHFRRAVESGNIVPVDRFDEDARTGSLPAVSWVTSSIYQSEHPPYSVKLGEAWTVERVNAVMRGPLWASTAIVIVWDEWGGFDDHVRPPIVEQDGLYERYGYRVPCLVIGAQSRRGYVSSTLYSHVSVLRTIGRLFDLEPLTERDAAANDLLDCFDFGQPPRPPLILV
jgi:phospholipase C